MEKEMPSSLIFVLTIDSRLFVGRKPPDEIIVIARLNELNALTSRIFSNKKITNVRETYRIKIFADCFNVSVLLNDNKLVSGFFKLESKISINKIIENKKYNPPIHCDEDLHKIKLSSKCLIFSKIEKPVEVNPETASKYASIKVIL